MQTRKDLLQAHRLMTQRASQALVLGEPDNPELPLRRLNVAAFSGVMVAVLVTAAFGIFGLIRPGGAKGLEQAGMLIIEKETGARYVWCEGEKLCPVANYVSARLLAGADAKSRRTVSRNSLTKFERGPTIGIPGAPNTLPDTKKLVKNPWSACVRSVDLGATGPTSLVSLVVGRPVGGRPLGDDQAIVVSADGEPWLIWKNRRMKTMPSVFTVRATQVSAKWLNALPAGADYLPPALQGRGAEAAGRGGRKARVGQIFRVDTASGTLWFVQLSDGLAPITEIEKELLLADPGSKQAYPGAGQRVEALSLDQGQVTQADMSPRQVSNPELSGEAPAFLPYAATTALCAIYDDPSGRSPGRVTVGGTLPDPPTSVAPAGVDQLDFPVGGAALAGSMQAPGKPASVSTYFLVTEGRRYALKSPQVAEKLGYQLSSAPPVPASVLGLIPAGPILDEAAAAHPLQVTTGNGQ